MTKVIGIIAVLFLATTSMAAVTGFDWAGVLDVNGNLEVPIGGTAVIDLVAVGAGTSGGMTAYGNTYSPFKIESGELQNIGGVWTSPGTSSDNLVIVDEPSNAIILYAFGTSASVAIPDGGLLARLVISVPAGTPYGTTALLSTDQYAGPSDPVTDGGVYAQANRMLIAVPEPVSALLLLAGLPLIRRRRA